MINVVTVKVRPPERLVPRVRNHGYRYTSDWVNRLKNMVARNLPLEHVFACVTDDPEGLDADIVPIEAPGLPGWWNKIAAFDPKSILADRIMVLDLDILIVGDLTPMVDYDAPFVTVRQWKAIRSPKTVPLYQGSVYVFDKGACRDVWERFDPTVISRFRSDGDWLAHLHPNEATFPDGWVVGIRDHMDGPPAQAKVMLCMEVFGGKNDLAARNLDWVERIWR